MFFENDNHITIIGIQMQERGRERQIVIVGTKGERATQKNNEKIKLK